MVKVQLFIIVGPDNSDSWISYLKNNDVSQYSAVDIVYYGTQMELVNSFYGLMHTTRMFFHVCAGTYPYIINHLIRNDCDFYIIAQNPASLADDLLPFIDGLIENGRHFVLVKGDPLIVYRKMSEYLDHFGLQSVEEKIDIHCKNHHQEGLVYGSISEFTS